MKRLVVLVLVLFVALHARADGSAWREGRANLDQIFPDWTSWEEAFETLERDVEHFSALREQPLESAEDLLRIMRARERAHRGARIVEGYVSLRLDLNAEDAEARQARDRVRRVLVDWDSRASVWYVPRVEDAGREQVRAWIAESEELQQYAFFLDGLFRQQEHRLSEKEESLLALADVAARNVHSIHQVMSYAEAPRPVVQLSGGEEVEITNDVARSLLWRLRNPADRLAIRQGWLTELEKRSGTYAALLDGVVGREQFVAKARGFDDPVDAALFEDAIPRSAIETLLAVGRDRSESIREYHRLRKAALELDPYRMSDRFIGIRDPGREIPYEEARRLIVESAEPLGSDVQQILDRAFDEGWIDAFERPGKRASGGATLVYRNHPYVRVNYRGTLIDLFSLAHELGHAVHSLLAHESQPFASSTYSTMTGEAVAMVHESLLVEHLIEQNLDPVVVIEIAIQNLLRSFYQPVIDADFEASLYETSEALSGKRVGELYGERLSAYFGDSVQLDPWDRSAWIEIPHFFTAPLYMMRYGLAYAAGSALVRDLTSEDPRVRRDAASRYEELLRAGGSDHPTALLTRAGADLTQRETIEAVADRLDHLVAQLRVTLDAQSPAPPI